MARTLLTGNILRSGSIPTTALGGGVVTSSAQIIASLPGGALSSSAQVDYPSISNIPVGIVSSSGQVSYLGVSNIPSGIASSSAQVTAYLPTGTVSSSGQVGAYPNIATTGSNTFTGIQTFTDTTNTTNYLDGALTVAGGMSVRKDFRVSGSVTINGLLTAVSMSTQYVTSSQYNIGVSKITLNDDDLIRFAGISIYDSGSSSPATASIYWDSLKHKFIYENLSGSSYNSAMFIAGPRNYGTLGDEVGLTDYRVPVAHGDDHIDSRLQSSSIRVDFPSRLTHIEAGATVTGSIIMSEGVFMNPSTLSTNVTIPAGYNGLLAGPITNTETITVEQTATLTIV